eukprot:4670409-Amphidinium_carterae.1
MDGSTVLVARMVTLLGIVSRPLAGLSWSVNLLCGPVASRHVTCPLIHQSLEALSAEHCRAMC